MAGSDDPHQQAKTHCIPLLLLAGAHSGIILEYLLIRMAGSLAYYDVLRQTKPRDHLPCHGPLSARPD